MLTSGSSVLALVLTLSFYLSFEPNQNEAQEKRREEEKKEKLFGISIGDLCHVKFERNGLGGRATRNDVEISINRWWEEDRIGGSMSEKRCQG